MVGNWSAIDRRPVGNLQETNLAVRLQVLSAPKTFSGHETAQRPVGNQSATSQLVRKVVAKWSPMVTNRSVTVALVNQLRRGMCMYGWFVPQAVIGHRTVTIVAPLAYCVWSGNYEVKLHNTK